MRAWLLMTGILLFALFGGKAFAMSGHDCAGGFHTGPSMAIADSGHHKHHAPAKPTPANDCCSGSTFCRMAGCAPAVSLPVPETSLAGAASESFRPTPAAVLSGLRLPPLLGPPRTLLS